MITFNTYRVLVAKSVRTVLQSTNCARRPKRTASAFAVTKNFRTSVSIYYFAPRKMRHKPASTKRLELCARSIPQLWGYKITTRIMIINHHPYSSNTYCRGLSRAVGKKNKLNKQKQSWNVIIVHINLCQKRWHPANRSRAAADDVFIWDWNSGWRTDILLSFVMETDKPN